ncbi:hypothetical protein F4703DRAFT_1827029 [Phycomyces blakesleeanus]
MATSLFSSFNLYISVLLLPWLYLDRVIHIFLFSPFLFCFVSTIPAYFIFLYFCLSFFPCIYYLPTSFVIYWHNLRVLTVI